MTFDIDALARRVRHVQDAVDAVVATGTTAGGEVTCRVDATGRLRGLEITEAALDSGARRLTEWVQQAHAAAITAAERVVAELRLELSGEPAVAQVADLLPNGPDHRAGVRYGFLEEPVKFRSGGRRA